MDASSLLDVEVLLVCDPVNENDENIDFLSSQGDRPGFESYTMIYNGLKEVAKSVVHFDSLVNLIDNLHNHKNSIVFPYWFGEISRNRHSLLPAICEAYNLPYIGADASTKAICNDKHLTKLFCAESGLLTPNGTLLTCYSDLVALNECQYPIVIKPNSQGSSLGIGERSLAKNIETAITTIEEIVKNIGWPVLCEEFVTGREVSICLIGNHKTEPDIRALSWAFNDDHAFLDKRLFTYALKYELGHEFFPVQMNNVITTELRSKCNRIFRLLKKAEVMRVDGRVTSNGFVVFELSPDLDMRPDGELATAFRDRFSTYSMLLKHILINTLESC